MLMRPLLVVACLLGLAYDAALCLWQWLAGTDVSIIRERRKHQRGLLDTESGFRVLREIDAAAQKAGAKVFLVSGTLLGLHRENRLLAHDYDVDVGIFDDDPGYAGFFAAMENIAGRQKTSITRLNVVECRLNPWLGLAPHQPVLYKYFFKNTQNNTERFGIDVFVHKRANGHIIHGNYRCLWINTQFQLERRKYGKDSFLVPRDTETYLLENYGDYTITNTRFESSVDCPNTTNLYGLRAIMWLTGRWGYFLSTKDPFKRQMIENRLKDCIRYGLFLHGKPLWQMNQYAPRKSSKTPPSASP